MALWLYAASSSFADASTTYDLAYRHGIVWRSYYADRIPPQAIPHVGAMAPHDTLYLGYRDSGRIVLVGRMRLGRPDQPEGISPVFTTVPAVLLADFTRHGYADDPVLRRMVGLFVEEVEPIRGSIPSPGRLTITRLSQDPSIAEGPPAQRIAPPDQRPPIVASGSIGPTNDQAAQQATDADGSFVGVDVGGRPNKGYDLCLLVWSKGVPTRVRFTSVPHATPLPSTDTLRSCVATGDLRQLSLLTHSAAASTAEALWNAIVHSAGSAPAGVFIDSPSAFARNAAGHGRLTEKLSLAGVSFQSTPSICCNSEHGADWGWLVYGMVAFAACVHKGRFTLGQWTEALNSGLYVPMLRGSFIIRECFPTATISHLRNSGRSSHIAGLIADLKEHHAERGAVEAYLNRGVHGVKQPRQPLFDRADALVAALSSLPHARQDYVESMSWPPFGASRWQAGVTDAHLIEGAIALPG